jgi:hypothetical protein
MPMLREVVICMDAGAGYYAGVRHDADVGSADAWTAGTYCLAYACDTSIFGTKPRQARLIKSAGALIVEGVNTDPSNNPNMLADAKNVRGGARRMPKICQEDRL